MGLGVVIKQSGNLMPWLGVGGYEAILMSGL